MVRSSSVMSSHSWRSSGPGLRTKTSIEALGVGAVEWEGGEEHWMHSGAQGLLKKVGEGVSAWPGSSVAPWPLARASGVWDRGKATRERGSAVPEGQGTRGSDAGEVSDAGELGWLGERMSTRCMPGVRWMHV
jgi:hypothetical protein